jgi:hypothetical protein
LPFEFVLQVVLRKLVLRKLSSRFSSEKVAFLGLLSRVVLQVVL